MFAGFLCNMLKAVRFRAFILLSKISLMQDDLQKGAAHNIYCKRRYFRVYKFSRISENWQFRADFFFAFLILLPLCSIRKVISLCIYFRAHLIIANNAKICTARKYVHSQYIVVSGSYRLALTERYPIRVYPGYASMVLLVVPYTPDTSGPGYITNVSPFSAPLS